MAPPIQGQGMRKTSGRRSSGRDIFGRARLFGTWVKIHDRIHGLKAKPELTAKSQKPKVAILAQVHKWATIPKERNALVWKHGTR